MAMRKVVISCVVVFWGCAVDLAQEQTSEVAVDRQAQNVNQGNVNQGNVNQGNVNQGNVNQGSTLGVMVVDTRDFFFGTTHVGVQLDGSRLGGIPYGATGTVWLPTNSSGGAPMATFTVRHLDENDTFGPPQKMRIIGSFTDSGNYGPSDAVNMLAPPYRPKPPRTMVGSLGTTAKGPVALIPFSPNSDIVFYQTQILTRDGTWQDFCQTREGHPPNAAVFTQKWFDAMGNLSDFGPRMGISCWDGTAVKCMRWGYKPWASLTPISGGPAVRLEPLFASCARAAMADYCGNSTSYTAMDTRIDLWDAFGFIPKSPKTLEWTTAAGDVQAFSDESAFDDRGAVCMVRERLYEIDRDDVFCPSTYYFDNGSRYCINRNPALSEGMWSSCGPKGVWEVSGYIFERGRMNDCVAQATRTSRKPLVFIASWTSACNHPPTVQGATLGEDCNCVTASVCHKSGTRGDGMPWSKCCEMDATGHQIHQQVYAVNLPSGNVSRDLGLGWNSYCVAEAARLLSLPASNVCGVSAAVSPVLLP
jgi:ADYC domain